MGAAGILAVLLSAAPANARLAEPSQARSRRPRLTLAQLVTPASRVESQGRLVRFALHGLVFFDTLTDLFRLHRRRGGTLAVRVRRRRGRRSPTT